MQGPSSKTLLLSPSMNSCPKLDHAHQRAKRTIMHMIIALAMHSVLALVWVRVRLPAQAPNTYFNHVSLLLHPPGLQSTYKPAQLLSHPSVQLSTFSLYLPFSSPGFQANYTETLAASGCYPSVSCWPSHMEIWPWATTSDSVDWTKRSLLLVRDCRPRLAFALD
jgi:hypothetical protein